MQSISIFRGIFNFGMVAGIMLASTAAFANENTAFEYDALGRLVKTTTAGTVNNGLTTTTGFDEAGNRKNYTVSGATSAGRGAPVIVIPLNGFTVIPLRRPNFGL